MSSTDPTLRERWGDDVYPPYVATPEERHRWDVCTEIARTASEVGEESGVADPTFVWHTTRWLYQSDMPIDDDAVDVRLTTEAELADEYARVVLEGLNEMPEPRTAVEDWVVVDMACDVLDAYLGDPSEWDLGGYEPRAVERRLLMEGNDLAGLHPRERLALWREKLGALQRFVAENRYLLTGETGTDAAAQRALRATVRLMPGDGTAIPNPELEAATLAESEGITLDAARTRIIIAARAELDGATPDGEPTPIEAVFSTPVQEARQLAAWAARHGTETRDMFALAHHVMRLEGRAAAALESIGRPELPIVEALLASHDVG